MSNFSHLDSTASCFCVTGHFEKSPPNDFKMTLICTRSTIPHNIFVLLVLTGPIFHFVLLYDQLFSRHRPFWNKCTEWPNMTFNPPRSNILRMFYLCRWVSNFTSCQSTASRSRVKGDLEKTALNDPQIDLNPTRSNALIYVLLVSMIPKFHPASLYK